MMQAILIWTFPSILLPIPRSGHIPFFLSYVTTEYPKSCIGYSRKMWPHNLAALSDPASWPLARPSPLSPFHLIKTFFSPWLFHALSSVIIRPSMKKSAGRGREEKRGMYGNNLLSARSGQTPKVMRALAWRI